MANRPRISQCLIVKNEEKNIEKALGWGRSIMWEQIVVDTGSDDKTVEIAAGLGAKLYYFSWINDFAAAKNYAISQAQGEWIVFCDADEYMTADDAGKLYQIIEQVGDKYDAISTEWLQLGTDGEVNLVGTQVRIFRNLPGLGYRRRIHEQLGFADGHPMHVGDAVGQIAIYHTGYAGEAFEKKNIDKRNLKLIELELGEHPDDYEMAGYMGDEYYAAADYVSARLWYQRSISGMPGNISEQDQRSAATYAKLMLMLVEQDKENNNQQDAILELYTSAIKRMSKEADFDYILGSYYAEKQDYKQGRKYLGRALQKLEQFGCTNRAMMLAANLETVYENLVVCHYHSHCFEQTVEAAVNLLKVNPYNVKVLYFLLLSFKRNGMEAQVDYTEFLFDFLDKLYHLDVLKDKVLILKAVQMASYDSLICKVEVLISDEEWEQLKRLGIERSNNGGSVR